MRECNDEHSFEFQICTVCAVGELNFNQKNEAYLSPVALGPLEGGEGALLHEEPAELAGVERRLLLRQLRRDPLAPLGRRLQPHRVQRPGAVLRARQGHQLALQD